MRDQTPSVYVTGESKVNLSHGVIVCSIVTPHPLPSAAWVHVGRLAHAVEDTAHAIARCYEAQAEPHDGPEIERTMVETPGLAAEVTEP